MKVQTEKTVIESTLTNNIGFGVVLDGNFAKMLSDTIYSDSIKAVIREISCNAVDSHVEAGYPDLPIDVQLPTELNPYFVVQDYGVGLDDEDLRNIYTVYGKSTKTDSNDYTGALGIGSKSPFAYQDSFTVVSVKNGKKYTALTSKDDEGVPQLSIVGTQDTEDVNGVRIEIPVNVSDLYDFRNKASEVFSVFDVHPAMIGNAMYTQNTLKFDKTETLGDCEVGIVFKNNYYYGGANIYAIQGNVLYNIDIEKLVEDEKEDDKKKIRNIFSSVKMDMYFKYPIGSVSFMPSRESVRYDKFTKETIKKDLKVFVEQITSEIQRSFDECETYWDACRKYNRKNQFDLFGETVQFGVENYGNIYYKGKLVKNRINFKINESKNFTFHKFPVLGNARKKSVLNGTENIEDIRYSIVPDIGAVIIKDTRSKVVARTEKYMEDNGKVLCMNVPKNYEVTNKMVKAVSRMFGGVKVERLSDIEAPISPASTSQQRVKDLFWNIQTPRIPDCLIEAEDGGFYVEMKHYKAVDYRIVPNLLVMLDTVTDSQIAYVRTSDIKKVEKLGWTNITELLTEFANKNLHIIKYSEYVKKFTRNNRMKEIFKEEIVEFEAPITKIKNSFKSIDMTPWFFVKEFADKTKLAVAEEEPKLDIVKEYFEKYEMLEVVCNHYNFLYQEDIEKIKNYVKLIDNQNTNETEEEVTV